eukprot:10803587-Karenia_brevis.AAC.1
MVILRRILKRGSFGFASSGARFSMRRSSMMLTLTDCLRLSRTCRDGIGHPCICQVGLCTELSSGGQVIHVQARTAFLTLHINLYR